MEGPNPKIFSFIRTNDVKRVKRHLTPENVNAIGRNNETSLSVALSQDLAVFELLIEHGANPHNVVEHVCDSRSYVHMRILRRLGIVPEELSYVGEKAVKFLLLFGVPPEKIVFQNHWNLKKYDISWHFEYMSNIERAYLILMAYETSVFSMLPREILFCIIEHIVDLSECEKRMTRECFSYPKK